jgi:polyisoprenoid-binding protein YceI
MRLCFLRRVGGDLATWEGASRPIGGSGVSMLRYPLRFAIVIVLAGAMAPRATYAEPGSIDLQNSTVTVFVFRSGLLSAFADNHTLSAPLTAGTISEKPPLAITIHINATDLTVLDANLDAEDRAAVRSRMLGADVLDVARFPTITFESAQIESTSRNRWNVSGQLTIHGITRSVTFAAIRDSGRYRGMVEISQRDFGITPIRLAGGVISVKDQLKIEFEIAVQGENR